MDAGHLLGVLIRTLGIFDEGRPGSGSKTGSAFVNPMRGCASLRDVEHAFLKCGDVGLRLRF